MDGRTSGSRLESINQTSEETEMNKFEYYWVKLHHYQHGDKELQNEDYFALMGQISKHLRQGWVLTYMKMMNRREDNEI